MIEEIMRRWCGSFNNRRQVEANVARGEPMAPELTREHRSMEVLRLEAPQLGEHVLFFEEIRESRPELAHRQRVMVLVDDSERKCPRAQQLFFRTGPTYDRPRIEPEAVARMVRTDFRHEDGCDLFFSHEDDLDRFRASMLPGSCRYDHAVDGPVVAEFDMLLHRDQLWYRDRSIRVADGRVRGEIDGFSWLLFDRRAPMKLPGHLARQQGVWKGTWRSYDHDSLLQETFEGWVVPRFIERDGVICLEQTNHYPSRGGARQTIESSGEYRDGRIVFANERAEGWSERLSGDPTGRGSVIVINYRDGSCLYEIVTTSDDGRRRTRSVQFIRDGRLLRRTLIDEEKVSDDWQPFLERLRASSS